MQIIEQILKKIIGELGYEAPSAFALEHPKDESHGDYASNIALVLAKSVGKNPREVAAQIAGSKLWESSEASSLIQKLEVAGPGFINFYLHDALLFQLASEAATVGRLYGSNKNQVGQKIMVEYTDPNPFKELHIGHLMSNTIGESVARLKEAEGAEVVRSNYQGDVGLHVAKSIWGIMESLGKSEALTKMEEMAGQELAIRQKFLGQAYALGATKYEDPTSSATSLGARAEIQALNKVIYDGSDPVVMQLYKLGREWSLEYFEVIYKRLGTKFDQYFFESETGGVGLSVVDEGLSKGVLELGEGGAVVYHGEKDGLHTRVFRNKLGLPTYEAKELGLAVAKYERYKYDQSVVVTANEITEYFRVIISVMSQLYPELAAKTIHKPHGMMKLKSGKMSSRTGKVVTGEGLLDELAVVVRDKMGAREVADKAQVADKVAVAALKYTVLKQAVGGDIVYEPETMTNLEGDTGPYLLYSYARAKSVLQKANHLVPSSKFEVPSNLCAEESAVVRYIYRYPEVVASAAKSFAPHMICSYLNELARRFNSFYAKCRIADAEDAERTRRVVLTQAVAQVLSNGLDILGIATVEEM